MSTLGGMLLLGCGLADDGEDEQAYRDRYAPLRDEVQRKRASGECKIHRVWGELTFVNCGIEVNGPGYYVHEPSGMVLEVCGGACMAGRGVDGYCVACPPPEWTCTP